MRLVSVRKVRVGIDDSLQHAGRQQASDHLDCWEQRSDGGTSVNPLPTASPDQLPR